jgi:hypothetical protein
VHRIFPRLNAAPAVTKPESPVAPQQLDFFGIANATLIYQIKPKFARRKRKKRTKGLQYKMQLKVRQNERKLAFRSKAPKEHLLKNEDTWTETDIRRLHFVLLVGSLITLRDHAQIDSVRAAEIWTWINRKGFDDFSFDACVAIAGELSIDPSFRNPFPEIDIDFAGADPDALRNMAAYLVRRNFGELPPHAGLLRRGIRAAESGDTDAIEWCLAQAGDAADADDSTQRVDQLSFESCCDALGFEPEDVRRMIALPAVTATHASRAA